jgi:hypothetical protein
LREGGAYVSGKRERRWNMKEYPNTKVPREGEERGLMEYPTGRRDSKKG